MKETKFKQTEIGEVPEDWEVTTLGKLGKFSKGAGISREQSHSGTIPAIRYGEIYTTHHDYIKQFNSFISEEVAKTSRKLEYGDLLFSSSGETKEEIGKSVAFVSDFEAYAGGDIIIISPDTKKYYPKFWGFYLNSMPIVKQKALRGQGDAVVHIVSKDLASIIVAHPKPEEQERIAEALSDVDGLLRELDGVIAKKRAIKQGAMQELLTGKRRLEGFTGEWEEKKLGKVIDVEKGEQVNGSQLSDSNNLFPMLNGGATFSGYYPFANQPANTITISEGGNSCGFVNYVSESFWAGGHCYVVRPLIDVDLLFLYQILKYRELDIMKLRVGSGLPNIQRKTLLSDITLLLPTNTKEQTAIANILSDMDEEIVALEAKRAKYEQVKQGMMQELLTGKIRLV